MRDGRPTKEKIRQAALLLFVDRGVDAVSLRDIAEAVGIRPSTIYVHWKSREALVSALFTEGYAAYGGRIADAMAGQASFPGKLEAAIRLVCRLESEDATLFKFLLLTQHGGLHAVADGDANPIDLLARMVRDAVAAGTVTGWDPDLLTAVIVGAVVQAATFRLYGRIGRSLAQMADEIVALCLAIATSRHPAQA
ncbi:MAG TPA: TetR/AcrR family transcriptional regulator [Aliidongia sp.]|uniref:TetR/AcrR family transcriptional regulator n=1 Tax=Aliidongia sp. TaxID=1914230 RepID=UPI002DDD46FC|nr:TetR/AcrR family transcriptional regulator [Aliidongia sp.]HEV2673475.1 TetR/AcrR family transcriptional regulator [Aliidongia sp.]